MVLESGLEETPVVRTILDELGTEAVIGLVSKEEVLEKLLTEALPEEEATGKPVP